MGNGFTGPPAVDFYSMLSGLGDTLAKNRQDQAKRDALAQATAPGADFRSSMLNLAQVDPQTAAVLVADRNHNDTLAHQTIEDKRNASNDARAASQFQQTYALQKRSADRADDPTPDNFVPDPSAPGGYRPIGPATPEYKATVAAAVAKAEAESSSGKPVPFETLSGTRFMVRQPDGSYGVVNPSALGSPAPQPSVAPPAQSTPGTPVAPPQPSIPAPSGPPAAAAPPPGGPNVPPVAVAPPGPPTAQPTPQADLTAIDPQTGRREDWLKAQPSDVQAYIKKIADYEVDPRTTSIKGGHREQVMSAVAQYDPTYNQNEFGTRAKAMKDFGTGPQGNSVRSFDVAIDHLDLLKRYTKALDSGDVRAINSLRNRWLEETGSPLPTNLQAVAPIVGAEVSKAVIGSNNALADREELRAPLRSANSVPQINGAIEAYQGLMAGQLKGLKKQYEDTTGKKNFDSRVRETTRNVLLGKSQDAGNSTQPNVTTSGIKWSVQ